MSIFFFHVDMHITCMPAALVEQKMASNPLELQFQMVVNYHVVLSTQCKASARTSGVLNYGAISSASACWILVFPGIIHRRNRWILKRKDWDGV